MSGDTALDTLAALVGPPPGLDVFSRDRWYSNALIDRGYTFSAPAPGDTAVEMTAPDGTVRFVVPDDYPAIFFGRPVPARDRRTGLTSAPPVSVSAGDDDSGAIFLDVHDFVSLQIDPPAPLWGSRDITLLPAGGLCLFAGRPGVGKTTWLLDLVVHLASGVDYPPQADDRSPAPYSVPRPLRIAIIENEGPLEMFRDKLAQKMAAPGAPDIRAAGGYLGIQVWRWGAFSFADADAFARAEQELDALQIDLVVGDPLSMLGVEGVGSPADTRAFIQILHRLGLGTTRAFMFLHHFRERAERTEDELAKISGAWGGHLDTLVTLSAMGDADQVRLAFPKVRWARTRQPDPIIMGRVYNTASFESLRAEGDLSLLEPMIAAHLAELRANKQGYGGRGWQTYPKVAEAVERRRADIKRALEHAPHVFARRSGEDAKSLGARTANTILWGLAEWDDAPGDHTAPIAGPPDDAAPVQHSFDDDIPF